MYPVLPFTFSIWCFLIKLTMKNDMLAFFETLAATDKEIPNAEADRKA
jgi:hypothetical protein